MTTMNEPVSPVKIWVDHDATPGMILEILYRVAQRRQVRVVFVANRWHQHPKSPWIEGIAVADGADVADDYIVERCGPGQLVVTADIPLSARAVEQGALVLNHRGKLLTAAEVREVLSLRDFHQGLRDAGVETGGPRAYASSDRQAFANALDRWLAKNVPPAGR